MNNDKELSVVKTQASKALQAVVELEINTTTDYAKADEMLGKIKTVGKMIKTKKEEITKPINDSLRKIRELFKPIETTHEEAEVIIKKKMIDFRIAEEARLEAEKAKIIKKVETGYIKPETAVSKIGTVGDVKSNLKEVGVKTSVRTLRKIRIVNEADVPREYMTPDLEKIKEAMLKGGINIAGCEIYEEKIIS